MQVLLCLICLIGSWMAFADSYHLLEPLLIFFLVMISCTRYNKAVNEEDPVIHAILLVLLVLFTLLFMIGLFIGFMTGAQISIKLFSSVLLTTLLLLITNIISALDFIQSIDIGRNFFILLFIVTHVSLYYCIGKGLVWIQIDIGAIVLGYLLTNLKWKIISKGYS